MERRNRSGRDGLGLGIWSDLVRCAVRYSRSANLSLVQQRVYFGMDKGLDGFTVYPYRAYYPMKRRNRRGNERTTA